jgi:biopolymer transport protein ExbD
MRLPEEPDLPPQIYIVPMIDVIFALLTFFIMSTLYLTRSEGLPINLPNAVTAEAQRSAPVTVTIDRAGKLFLNKRPTDLKTLGGQVRKLASQPQTLVIVSADEGVSHGRVVTVMDQLRLIPNVRMAIATQRK